MRRHLPSSLVRIAALVMLSAAWGEIAAQAVDPQTGQVRQPATINELTDAYGYTFAQILTPEELERLRHHSPEEVQAEWPELYEKLHQNVTAWTDSWIAYAEQSLARVGTEKLERADASITRVDNLLREYFEERGWDYRKMSVVVLPQRLFHDSRNRYSSIGGMFIRYYPGKFFATINPAWPFELVLLHESFHVSMSGVHLGHGLAEGLPELAAEHIAVRSGLMTKAEVRKRGIYEDEVAGVRVILDEMVARLEIPEEQALDRLLGVLVTGDHEPLRAIFGAPAWEDVLTLSRSGGWNRRKILKALGTAG